MLVFAKPKPACHVFKGVARLVSHCARPTRGVFDRALREHRRLMGYPFLLLHADSGSTGQRESRNRDIHFRYATTGFLYACRSLVKG